jgi:voltage-gated sodium channel
MSLPADVAPWRLALAHFLERPWVANGVIVLIAINALILGIETRQDLSAAEMLVLQRIDHALLAVFVLELALKLLAYGLRFFRDPWNVFDFVIIGVALVPASESFSVLRALRILRALRLVSMVPSMRRVVGALLGALPGMGAIVALLVLVIYVAAVMATKLFHEASPEFFGTLGRSTFTLFQIMTVEGWPDIARGVMKTEPWAWVFFVVYLVTATFTVLNLFIAVIVNAMQDTVQASTEAVVHEAESADARRDAEVMQVLRELRAEVAALRAELPGKPG